MQPIQAAVLIETSQPLELKTIYPRDLKKGQVLVEILFSGVCRSQLMEVKGLRGEDKWLPHLLGHEGSGIVIATGEGVSKVKIGDEVILTWIKGDGIEAEGAQYDAEDGSIINSGKVTTFSTHSVVSENRIVKKPRSLSFKEAMLFGCALPTGAGMVLNEIKPTRDAKVVVIGLGGIGLSSVAMLISLGIKNIIAVDISQEKLKLVESWGIKSTIDASLGNIKNDIFKIYKEGADFCIESAGKTSTIEIGFSVLNKHNGLLLFASHPPEGEKISLSPHELITGKNISGSWGGAIKPDRDIPILYKTMKKSNFPLDTLISKSYPLSDINIALNDLDEGKVLRPLIHME